MFWCLWPGRLLCHWTHSTHPRCQNCGSTRLQSLPAPAGRPGTRPGSRCPPRILHPHCRSPRKIPGRASVSGGSPRGARTPLHSAASCQRPLGRSAPRVKSSPLRKRAPAYCPRHTACSRTPRVTPCRSACLRCRPYSPRARSPRVWNGWSGRARWRRIQTRRRSSGAGGCGTWGTVCRAPARRGQSPSAAVS
jgi:hypothetical protein